ncbi:cytochrome P450 2F3 [Microcaecilia unicolor]|uniref:Cytochrome P450 2F3-like n=1 Tax=Microcaecilia unicolor TaxID=1415580 RepID=A0A6P7ZG67_9AMPH|nr:cytochrome P450 2F3-like [Microcaecilia unicolor]
MDASGALLVFMIIFLSCLMLFRNGKGWKKERQLPPGPTPLPLIGNLLQLNMNDMVKSLTTLSEKYGSVYTVYLGTEPSVVLHGYKAVKEALIDQGEEFSGRGEYPVVFRFTQGNGIAFTNGEKWKNLRRFALQTLRNFGVGKKSVEERIKEEAYFLVKEFKKTNGEPFDPTFVMSKAVSNVICSVVFGNRFDYYDKNFLTLLGLINENFQLMSSIWGTLYNIYPNVMKHLPGPHNKIFANFEKLKLFVLERIKMHDELFDANCPRDFIDCFLAKMKQEEQNPETSFHTETLVMTTHNLFFGGTETVSTTLRYGFLILMKYPEIKAKVHEEIDQVIGRNRSPAIEDRNRMPYTDAVIHEVQRFTDIIPLSLPHCVIRDTMFRGYTLPRGTNVITILSSVHYDPTQYKNPKIFDPNNFLDNTCFKKNDAFMPFSSGKRICLGEGLARMELFLYFTTLLQNFDMKPVISKDEIDLTPQCSGLGNVPRPYQFCVIPR